MGIFTKPFPELPSDRPDLLIGRTVFETCRDKPIAEWAFRTIRSWAESDHKEFIEFYADFKRLEKLYRELYVTLLGGYKTEASWVVNIEVNQRRGRTAREHLMLLATCCGRGWHHLVGDLLAYSCTPVREDGPTLIEPLSWDFLNEVP